MRTGIHLLGIEYCFKRGRTIAGDFGVRKLREIASRQGRQFFGLVMLLDLVPIASYSQTKSTLVATGAEVVFYSVQVHSERLVKVDLSSFKLLHQ